MSTSALYNEEYFECGIESGKSCYVNYRWMPELTIPFCHRIIQELGITAIDTVLDYGCAKGYLVLAFRLLYINAFGVDISEYAIKEAPLNVAKYLKRIDNEQDIKDCYDWIISKDVFEHIEYRDIDKVLSHLSTRCFNMFCIIPLGKNGRYIIDYNNLDYTHIIKESGEWWLDKLNSCGFNVINSSYEIKGMKERCKVLGGNIFITSAGRWVR